MRRKLPHGLQDNSLLENSAQAQTHCLLEHWGTTAGLNFIYVHLNQLIKEREYIDPLPGGNCLFSVADTYVARTKSPRSAPDAAHGMVQGTAQLAAVVDQPGRFRR